MNEWIHLVQWLTFSKLPRVYCIKFLNTCTRVPKTSIPTYILRLNYSFSIIQAKVRHCRILTIFENKVLRRIFEPRMEKQQFHHEKFNSLYSSPY
jgi:hypothetical protein